MTIRVRFAGALSLLVMCSLPLWGQVVPVPIPGGDIIQPFGLFNQFFPGVGAGFDGLNADPPGINNSRTFVAMGYTAGTATDSNGKTYNVITDIRVYQGDYVGAEPNGGAGRTKSAKAHGTFVEIWIDLYDPSSGLQVHDFNPGITPNGVFWIVQIPDDAVQISGDSLTIHLQNITVADQFQFPGGTGNVPATVSFDITYTKSGMPRRVRPTSSDPLSPFTWAGKMSMATNSGTFSVAYKDTSFAATGSFSSSSNFGEMGMERNGSFASEKDDDAEAELLPMEKGLTGAGASRLSGNESTALLSNLPLLKGRVPIKGFQLRAAP